MALRMIAELLSEYVVACSVKVENMFYQNGNGRAIRDPPLVDEVPLLGEVRRSLLLSRYVLDPISFLS